MHTNTKTAVLTVWHVAVAIMAIYGSVAYSDGGSMELLVASLMATVSIFTVVIWVAFLVAVRQEPGDGR